MVLYATLTIFITLLLPNSALCLEFKPLQPSRSSVAPAQQSRNFSCLPSDVRGDEVLSPGSKGAPGLTVNQKLTELGARCRKGKLVDRKARQIRFFRPSCWGNPPLDYLEIKAREDLELKKLRRRFTVIVFGCDIRIQ
jgi:hypothetical protein